jgi:hypothetical protein
MLLCKCDRLFPVHAILKSYCTSYGIVIVVTIAIVYEGYCFSILKSTMIWPIVQETVLNVVCSSST